jgi:hypothetical protein
VDPAQLRALTDDLRAIHGRDHLLVSIDQEGGRVARLRPPHWSPYPCGEAFAKLYDIAPASAIQAARDNATAMALELSAMGITVDYHPPLDLRLPDAHDVIGDRAFGSDPVQVAALGRAILEGLAAGGVTGCIKHMPGHGRTDVDTHKALPTVTASAVELEDDLAPFCTLNQALIGMTGHLVFTAWDAENPATLSPTIIHDIIRGEIGFDGLLLTDDIDMQALGGTIPERAARNRCKARPRAGAHPYRACHRARAGRTSRQARCLAGARRNGGMSDADIPFMFPPESAKRDADALYLAIDGWEGPLDLMLDLARRQKVDLRQISILALVDQYLGYIERAGAMKLELAADYLVMAAWLAYLKSALLLPKDEQEDPSPEDLALRLQLRLQRLGAMREAAARLMGRDRIGRDVFVRGAPEGLRTDRKTLWAGESAHGPAHLSRRQSPGDDLGFGARAGFGDARGDARMDGNPRFSPAPRLARTQALGAGLVLCRRARTGEARHGGD